MKISNIFFKIFAKKISAVPVILILSFALSCGNRTNQNVYPGVSDDEWWYPIIVKHNIDLSKYNYKATFNCIDSNKNIINRWLELGNDNGSDEKYLKLKDALLIVMFDTANLRSSKNNYWILSSPGIFQDLERKTIDYDWGNTIWYDINEKDIIPLDTMQSYGKFDFNYGIKIEPSSFRKITP